MAPPARDVKRVVDTSGLPFSLRQEQVQCSFRIHAGHRVANTDQGHQTTDAMRAAMIDEARLLAELHRIRIGMFAERDEATVREGDFPRRQIQIRVDRIELVAPLLQLDAARYARFVRMLGEQAVPDANERLIAPGRQEQMAGGAAQNGILIATQTRHRECVLRCWTSINDEIGIARKRPALP